MDIEKTSFVISPHNPRRKWLLILFMVLFVILIALVSRVESIERMKDNYEAINNLEEQLASTRNNNQLLHEKVLQSDRTIEVLKKSQEITASENKRLQEEIYTLKKDLNLYKRVMGEKTTNETRVKVVGFDLKPLNEPGRFHYEITMVQMAQKHRWVEGTLTGTVNGVDGAGNKKQFDWQSLIDVSSLPVRFRYYQELKGELTLPAGFKAEAINFSLKIKGQQLAIEQHFLWPLEKETLVHVQDKRENKRT